MSSGASGSDEKISASKCLPHTQIQPLDSEQKFNTTHDLSSRGATGSDRNIDQARLDPTAGNRGQYQHPEPHAEGGGSVGPERGDGEDGYEEESGVGGGRGEREVLVVRLGRAQVGIGIWSELWFVRFRSFGRKRPKQGERKEVVPGLPLQVGLGLFDLFSFLVSRLSILSPLSFIRVLVNAVEVQNSCSECETVGQSKSTGTL
ncbi:hypothetical protein KC338_g315 [Hortaea werneckii]|nr:hypothetical protein KC338_g315 [Hortaea werneckii]